MFIFVAPARFGSAVVTLYCREIGFIVQGKEDIMKTPNQSAACPVAMSVNTQVIRPAHVCFTVTLALAACDHNASNADDLREGSIDFVLAETPEDSDQTEPLSAARSNLTIIDLDGSSLVASVAPDGAPQGPWLVEPDELDAMISGEDLDGDIEPDQAVGVDRFATPQDPVETGPGTFTLGISALSCVAQGGEFSGASTNCLGGGTIRTNGDTNVPCSVRAPLGSRTTYICELELPTGARIDEITAHGSDFSSDGYMEAAVWRAPHGSFGVQYVSPSFEGNWQNSGVAAAPGLFSFPIYLDTDAPHQILSPYRYMIGFGLERQDNANVTAYGFQVTYTIL